LSTCRYFSYRYRAVVGVFARLCSTTCRAI